MYTITHDDATKLEYLVKDVYKCERAGVSGLAEAGYFEIHPMQAAILIVAYVHARGLEVSSDHFDEFLHNYELKFEYPEGDMQVVVNNYIDELTEIVERIV